MRRNQQLTTLTCAVALAATLGNAAPLALVRNGDARAQIVVPDEAFPVVQYAAEELRYHIRTATGAELAIVAEADTDTDVPHHIYLGACRATRTAGIELEPEPPPAKIYAGKWRVKHIIRTGGDDLFMTGHDNGGPVGSRFQMTRHGTLFAVYDFLENQMEVRWLWPGELGEVIPRRTDLVVDDLSVSARERFAECEMGTGNFGYGKNHWQSQEHFDAYTAAVGKWLLRHRMNVCNAVTYSYGHYFHQNAKYTERFLKERPDFFQLLPDGTRGYIPGCRGHMITMCVSNPALHAQMVRDWQSYRTIHELVPRGGKVMGGLGWMLNACENDTCAACTCERCRAWDAPDPRFEKHDYWNGSRFITEPGLDTRYQAARPDDDGDPAPELSDRYARFYLTLQKKAEKVDPGVVVFGYAYSNYTQPPKEVTLNDRIVISMVPWPYFPWTQHDIETMKAKWDGWHATGARLKLRPNTLHTGHDFPVFLARKMGEMFAHHIERSAVATAFDSLTGQWGSKGPDYYVLTRMHVHPDWPVENVLDEYYAGFGKAKEAVRRYFQYWEQVSEAATDNPPEGVRSSTQAEAEGGGWLSGRTTAITNGMLVFTPEVMANGRRLIEKAMAEATGAAVAQRRVAFLGKGLKHAELTLLVARTHQVQTDDLGNAAAYRAYAAAMGKLMAFRREVVEPEMVADTGYLGFNERRKELSWDHSLTGGGEAGLASQWRTYFANRAYGKPREYEQFEKETGARRLGKAWRFRPDPDKRGTRENWQAEDLDDTDWAPIGVDSHWKDQPWGNVWRAAHNDDDFQGVGWYRLRFPVPDGINTDVGRVQLFFGAIDSAAEIWLNGTHIATRPFHGNAWQEPFEVNVTDTLRRDGRNSLAVRVDHVKGAGGIWKPVWLVAAEGMGGENWGFEDAAAGLYDATRPNGGYWKSDPRGRKPHVSLAPWQLALPEGQKAGFVRIVEGDDAPEGKRYLQTVSFHPFVQRIVSAEAGTICRLTFQCRKANPDTPVQLAVFWNEKRVMDKAPTDTWTSFTLTLEGTGSDLLRFQRTGSANVCLDAVRLDAAP